MRGRQASNTYEDEPGQVHHRVREGWLIFSIALAALLFCALVTYHRTDPSWSDTGLGNHVANAGGRVGAWFADIFFYGFGYVAFLFPCFLLYSGWLVFRNDPENEDASYGLLMIRLLGFVLTLSAGSGFASLCFSNAEGFLPFSAGGVCGDFVSQSLATVLNGWGGGLLLFTSLLVGVTLYTGVSWLKMLIVAGRGTWLGFSFIHRRSEDFRDHLAHRRALREDDFDEDDFDDEEDEFDEDDEEEISEKPPKISAIKSLSMRSPRIESIVRKKKRRQMPLFDESLDGPLPPISLLDPADEPVDKSVSDEVLEMMSREVEARLLDFGIDVEVVAVHPGPVVTRFELKLAAGLKVSKISGLAKDLARSLSVVSVRIVEVIPGKSVVGLELPNENREIVRLSDVLSSESYETVTSTLSLALGKDIAGHPVIVDLAKMPHLLVAGTTGSGKSVGLNVMVLSLLYKAVPSEVRMIMIDPKMLELSIYEGIPHLLAPVVVDMKEAANALRWCVAEMDRRYRLMATLGVRNLAGYNLKIKEAKKKGQPLMDPFWKEESGDEPAELETLPYIVVFVDEFADMMMVVGKKVEELIARIAQKARAAGIHMILATQRPSVDVITGLIKANIPTRIAFQVSSKIDSRTILDQQGAEQLLGNGDMLYLAPGTGVPVRVHGAYASDEEVHAVVEHWRAQGSPEYINAIVEDSAEGGSEDEMDEEEEESEQDPLYDQAVDIVVKSRRASISNIQRRLKIGYNRAARMVEDMESAGIVSAMESNGLREVLAPEVEEM